MTTDELKAWLGIGTIFAALSGWLWRLHHKVNQNCKTVRSLTRAVFPDKHEDLFITAKELREKCVDCKDESTKTEERLIKSNSELKELILDTHKKMDDLTDIKVSIGKLETKFDQHIKNGK